MRLVRLAMLTVAVGTAVGLGVFAQEKKESPKAEIKKEAGDKKEAKIVLLIPESPTKTSLKIEGKDLEVDDDSAKNGKRIFTTPALEVGKTYAYKVEATIEPNNYTKIVRTREITFKAGEEVTIDLRKKDEKIKDNVIIRWVPTPKVVVKDMCELAKIGKDDVVMDPGCGDGIMIITAVQDFKAKAGIGVDYDPKKAAETIENVKKLKLDGVIKVREGNALKLEKKDLEEVTVVMLYMGNELNIRLRPALWEHLKPGSRIVSHRFTMGDWAPDKTIKVNRDGDYGNEDFELHVWTITGKEKTGDYKKKPVTDD